ncbi:DoxX family protein [Candidatus Peregrinibacteria bacterium]|nr:DoxX family protein [Candidatus Peregrinibacteria bacterium]
MTTFSPQGSLKKDTILYWVTTALFFVLVPLPAIFFNTTMAIDGMAHLGFPHYFGVELGIAKIIGGIVLIVPMVPKRLKEWAYVGFGIDLVSALIALIVVDGLTPIVAGVVVGFILLAASYISFHTITD